MNYLFPFNLKMIAKLLYVKNLWLDIFEILLISYKYKYFLSLGVELNVNIIFTYIFTILFLLFILCSNVIMSYRYCWMNKYNTICKICTLRCCVIRIGPTVIGYIVHCNSLWEADLTFAGRGGTKMIFLAPRRWIGMWGP